MEGEWWNAKRARASKGRRTIFRIGGGGQDYQAQPYGVLGEGVKRPSGGKVWEGGIPPRTVGTYSKMRVSKLPLTEHLKTIF